MLYQTSTYYDDCWGPVSNEGGSGTVFWQLAFAVFADVFLMPNERAYNLSDYFTNTLHEAYFMSILHSMFS
jgi:hypothetical protein